MRYGKKSTLVLLAAILLMGMIPAALAQKRVIELPRQMSPRWKAYFEQVDFDGDSVPYIYDKYLGRDDASVDFARKQGGILRLMGADIRTLDPIMVVDVASHQIVGKIFEPLAQMVPAATEVMPCLAKAWEISDDGLVYTFYLREGVRFHNGELFTADDVIYSFHRLMDPSHASKRISFVTDYMEAIDKVDDHTVRIHLRFPFMPFLSLMTYSCFHIMPQDYTSANEHFEDGRWVKEWVEKPIGTGPFKFRAYESGDYWELEANEDYWAGRPYLDGIWLKVCEETATVVQAFKAGQINVVGVPAEYWEEFTTTSAYKEHLITRTELATYYYVLNCKKWPFENKLIRQAVACAMDREGVLQTIFKGRYLPAHGPLPPGCFGFSQQLYDLYAYSYNPLKARALLDKAGAIDTDGDGIREYQGKPLKFELSAYIGPTWRGGAKSFKANLKEVGIEIRYQEYEFATITMMGEDGNFVMLSLGWIMDFPDPENFYILWETKSIPDPNYSRYSNPEADALIGGLRSELNPQVRKELCYNIERIIQEDHPNIWFFHSRGTACVQPYLHDYDWGDMGSHIEKLLGVYLEAGHRG